MDKDWIMSRIEKYRKEKGLSKSKLNDLAGFPKSMIYRWYGGSRMPTLPALEKICGALGVSLSEFFCGDKEGKRSPQDIEIANIFSDLTEEEKAFVIAAAKGVRDLNHPKR